MNSLSLPAGLLDSNIELFVSQDLQAYKLKDKSVVAFNDFDEQFLAVVDAELQRYPEKEKAALAMGNTDRKEQLRQFLICNYGGFDNQPDFVDGKFTRPEFWPCPKRGQCEQEGTMCDALLTQSGEYLTRQEIRVLELIASGLLDKEIADRLSIELTTVKAHNRNIRYKTGLARKPDLTRFAITKNLIA